MGAGVCKKDDTWMGTRGTRGGPANEKGGMRAEDGRVLNVEESMCDKTIRCQFLSLSHGTDVKGKGTWGTGEMLALAGTQCRVRNGR